MMPKPTSQEARGADAEVHQVFHQDIAGVFGPGEAGLAHGEARLHEKDQHCAQQTQMVLTELNSIVVSSHFCLAFFPANGSA